MRARLVICVLGALLSALSAHLGFQQADTAGAGVVFAFVAGVFAGFGFITWQDERIGT